MKHKKKEDPSVYSSFLLRMGNKIPVEEVTETKFRAELEGMTVQRLPHLGIHPINNHQTQTLDRCQQVPAQVQSFQEKSSLQSVDTSFLLRMGNKIPMEAVTETKFRAELEGMTVQRLPHLGVHPINNHQTQTLDRCQQEPAHRTLI